MDSINEMPDEANKIGETIDDKEEFDNYEDLAEKKRAVNEFNAKENIAQTQIFIQGLHNLHLGEMQNGQPITSKISETKTFDLKNQEECIEFVECYKRGEYLSVAIVLAVFEIVAVSDLVNLESKLLEYLPIANILNTDEDIQLKKMQQDAYLSLRTILSVIGGKNFTSKEGQQCVGLGKGSEQILRNFFELFPTLRGAIITWIIQISSTYKYRTAFDAYQIVMAYVRIISVDFLDAKRSIFPKLYSSPLNAGLLGNVIYILYGNVKTHYEAQDIIVQWINSDSTWLWRPLCLSYSQITEEENNFKYEAKIKRMIGKRLFFLRNSDYVFIAQLLFQSKGFRTLFAEVFAYTYDNASTEEEKVVAALLYIKLIRQSYYMVRQSHMELPLVACDTKGQQKCLTNIVGQVMSEYRLRKQLYTILEAYMRELSSYHYSTELIRHVSAYFYNMSLTRSEYRRDILDFLKNCHIEVAQQIYKQLY